jgi:condensin complex subunit 2
LKKFDLEFAVDPLFKKTSADFDEGGARGLLLNHLSTHDGLKIIFDASDVTADTKEEEEEKASSGIEDKNEEIKEEIEANKEDTETVVDAMEEDTMEMEPIVKKEESDTMANTSLLSDTNEIEDDKIDIKPIADTEYNLDVSKIKGM